MLCLEQVCGSRRLVAESELSNRRARADADASSLRQNLCQNGRTCPELQGTYSDVVDFAWIPRARRRRRGLCHVAATTVKGGARAGAPDGARRRATGTRLLLGTSCSGCARALTSAAGTIESLSVAVADCEREVSGGVTCFVVESADCFAIEN